MPVVLYGVGEIASRDLRDCSSQLTQVPEDPRVEGCPRLAGPRALAVPQGLASIVEWEFRDAAGQPLDLATCLDCSEDDECGQVLVRFADALEPCKILEAEATVVDATTGIVRVALPSAVTTNPGLWQISFAAVDAQSQPRVLNDGLLSVEPSLWGPGTVRKGAPTINEIRVFLRDLPEYNPTLAAEQQFSNVEILQACKWPIQYWNETPPPIQQFTAHSFPYREAYLGAIASYLFRIASHQHIRNQLPATHGSMLVDPMGKGQVFLTMADRLEQRWKEFVLWKKASLNSRGFYGTVGNGLW